MGGVSKFIYTECRIPPFLPSFETKKCKRVCSFPKKKRLEVSQKKKRIQKTPKKRLFLLKERKKERNDHASVSQIKKKFRIEKERKKEEKCGINYIVTAYSE